jgi:hypothetical protein
MKRRFRGADTRNSRRGWTGRFLSGKTLSSQHLKNLRKKYDGDTPEGRSTPSRQRSGSIEVGSKGRDAASAARSLPGRASLPRAHTAGPRLARRAVCRFAFPPHGAIPPRRRWRHAAGKRPPMVDSRGRVRGGTPPSRAVQTALSRPSDRPIQTTLDDANRIQAPRGRALPSAHTPPTPPPGITRYHPIPPDPKREAARHDLSDTWRCARARRSRRACIRRPGTRC